LGPDVALFADGALGTGTALNSDVALLADIALSSGPTL
jgi:hypothetical protein